MTSVPKMHSRWPISKPAHILLLRLLHSENQGTERYVMVNQYQYIIGTVPVIRLTAQQKSQEETRTR
jgi:phosphoribulokinase